MNPLLLFYGGIKFFGGIIVIELFLTGFLDFFWVFFRFVVFRRSVSKVQIVANVNTIYKVRIFVSVVDKGIVFQFPYESASVNVESELKQGLFNIFSSVYGECPQALL